MGAELKAFVYGSIGVTALLVVTFVAVYRDATPAVAAAILRRLPLLLTGSQNYGALGGGFSANIVLSLWALLISLIAGAALCLGLISHAGGIRWPATVLMILLRNSPWLVVLYAMLYLLPFEFALFGRSYLLSPAAKAVVGLSLPVSANMAEIFRGGVEAIPTGQWESARSLGYRRLQILRYVVVPQAIPLMVPNMMSIYAALFIGTSLAVVTGTDDVLSVVRVVIGSDGDRLATGLYIFVLYAFFVFAFPIAILARWLERNSVLRR